MAEKDDKARDERHGSPKSRMLTFDENAAIHMTARRIIRECERMVEETLASEITTSMAERFACDIRTKMLMVSVAITNAKARA